MKRLKKGFTVLIALSCLTAGALAQSVDATARLAELGYLREDAENLDVAVQNFQTANGLEVTGGLDEATLQALASESALSKQEYLLSVAESYPEEPLVSGKTGDSVRQMQQALRDLGYYEGEADGVFGDATRLAVMAFQTANGLYASGEADRAMLLLLHEGQTLSWQDFIAGKVCERGDSGAGVRSLQRRLKQMGYYDGECTDVFGDSTQRAVERFQSQNGLEITGRADEETCRLLYSGTASAPADDGVMRLGDAGEDVREMQGLLSNLGYLSQNTTGEYGADTYVAVTLYQIANGLAPSGEADEALVESMRSQDVVPLSEAAEALRESEASVNADTLSRVTAAASEMLGQAFAGSGGSLFPGFPFVQYVYARAGVGLTDPGRILEDAAGRAFDAQSISAGEVVALEFSGESGASMLYAVSLGGTRVAYVDTSTGYIVSGDLTSMPFSNAYVWNFSQP